MDLRGVLRGWEGHVFYCEPLDDYCELVSISECLTFRVNGCSLDVPADGGGNFFPSKEQRDWSGFEPRTYPSFDRKAIFLELLKVRDSWWDMDCWVPNWADGREKYTIYAEGGIVFVGESLAKPEVLAFKSAAIRDNFYREFRDLVNLCREFI